MGKLVWTIRRTSILLLASGAMFTLFYAIAADSNQTDWVHAWMRKVGDSTIEKGTAALL